MSYQDFVMRTVKTQYASRTASEAFRDANYASAIHYPPSSHKTASEAFVGFLIVLGSVGFLVYMLFGYIDAIPK